MAVAVEQEGNVRVLRPIRVLVVSRDRPFLATARFLLLRAGLDAEASTMPGDVFERVQRGVDVVVIDATGALAGTARVAAELEALYPGIGIVMVADDHGPWAGAIRVLPKWEAADELAAAARRAYLRI
jgi:hypothetical protein